MVTRTIPPGAERGVEQGGGGLVAKREARNRLVPRPRARALADPAVVLVTLGAELVLHPRGAVPVDLDPLLDEDEQVVTRVPAGLVFGSLALEPRLGLEDALEGHSERPRLESVEQTLAVVVPDGA